MAFKELLLQLSSYPEATPISGLEQALEFSEVLGARISALTFEVDFYNPTNLLANAVVDIPGMFATERAKSKKNVQDLIKVFGQEATKRGLVHQHMIERALVAQIPVIVTEYSRLYDLTIFPDDLLPGIQRHIAECVIFEFRTACSRNSSNPTADCSCWSRCNRSCLGFQSSRCPCRRRCYVYSPASKKSPCGYS